MVLEAILLRIGFHPILSKIASKTMSLPHKT